MHIYIYIYTYIYIFIKDVLSDLANAADLLSQALDLELRPARPASAAARPASAAGPAGPAGAERLRKLRMLRGTALGRRSGGTTCLILFV